jgi:chromosome segregation ATPase
MLTGDPPCAEPSTTGSRAADRAILPCLAASSALRSQRMQRVLMELKLLHTTVRRAEASRREPPMNAAALRAELQQMESRIAEQIAGQERIVEERYGLASDAISALATRMEIMSAELAGVRQWMATRSETEDVIQRILARLDREFEAVGEHFHRVEMSVEHLRSHVGELQTSVATDLLEVETNLKSNSAAIESARAAAAQTDDLVERVVEALESLQSAILDHNEGPADRADAAVN